MSFKIIHLCICLELLAAALAGFVALAAVTHAAESVRLWKALPAKPYVLRGADRRIARAG